MRTAMRFAPLVRATRPPTLRTPFRPRFQSTSASSPATPPASSIMRRIWDSPVGVKTVHFWAPVMKWAVVLIGVSDFYRPPEKLSLSQNIALMCTGAIWTRWCLIIKPKNYLLAAVNFFLGCVGVIQVSRIFIWQKSMEGKTAVEEVENAGQDVAGQVKEVAKDVKGAAKEALN